MIWNYCETDPSHDNSNNILTLHRQLDLAHMKVLIQACVIVHLLW